MGWKNPAAAPSLLKVFVSFVCCSQWCVTILPAQSGRRLGAVQLAQVIVHLNRNHHRRHHPHQHLNLYRLTPLY